MRLGIPDRTNHIGGTGYFRTRIPMKAVPLYTNVFVDKRSKSARAPISMGKNIVWGKTTTQKRGG
jgi:hypothetical protein